MGKEQMLNELDLLKSVIEDLPDDAIILCVDVCYGYKFNQILLSSCGGTPEVPGVKTKTESNGATSKYVVISGIVIKWYAREENK